MLQKPDERRCCKKKEFSVVELAPATKANHQDLFYQR
jgi:hypothetical protein